MCSPWRTSAAPRAQSGGGKKIIERARSGGEQGEEVEKKKKTKDEEKERERGRS